MSVKLYVILFNMTEAQHAVLSALFYCLSSQTVSPALISLHLDLLSWCFFASLRLCFSSLGWLKTSGSRRVSWAAYSFIISAGDCLAAWLMRCDSVSKYKCLQTFCQIENSWICCSKLFLEFLNTYFCQYIKDGTGHL